MRTNLAERPAASQPDIDTAIAGACAKIPPLWPLKHFVAVNPFLGFSDQSFDATCATLRRVAGADMLMLRRFYLDALAAGTLAEADIAAALAGAPALPTDVAAFLALARTPSSNARPRAVVATVAEVLDSLADGDRQVSRTAFMNDEISKWCAAYFDDGQAAWKLPSRGLSPYAAWRATAQHDRNPEVMGLKGFRAAIAAMPADARAAIAQVVDAIGVPPSVHEDYLHRALFDIAGWAGYARYLVWDNALYGRPDDTLVELLAIRIVWGYALWCERSDPAFRAAWAAAMAAAAQLPTAQEAVPEDLAVDLVLHHAYEAAHRNRLLTILKTPATREAPTARPTLQAAFCIDVRSELYRRALEAVVPDAQTIGFAGFFGFPIEYVPIGQQRGGAQCPVLLTPAVTVCEAVHGAHPDEETEILGLRLLRRRAAKARKAFKQSAVSSFTFVETAGWLFAPKLVGDSARLTRPVPDPNRDGLDGDVVLRVGPRIAPGMLDGRPTGFATDRRIAMAEAVLRGMSLTQGFAPLVLLAGHGSTTVNNPHASGLDCGACGGHTGEANARVAATILNDAAVRTGLVARGITIPGDTWFVAGLHDTTTDELELYDLTDLPPSHRDAIAALAQQLHAAGELARRERAPDLGIAGGADIDRAVFARSSDWSQVRPEWGLAGNHAFIAAPRSRTQGRDFGGRAFLHSYDWQDDAGFGVLTLIMCAPMVVASWINLQYYGATVNNRVFGSGNKTLHNITGQIGVLEGNAGDLKPGLPWQSVHDGQRFVHEPLRLNVFIEAPAAAIDAVIAAHEGVRQLVDNGWVHLFRIDDDGAISRYVGADNWSVA